MKNQQMTAKPLRILLQLTFVFISVIFCNSSYAGGKTWTGNVNTDWANPGNWSPSGTPSSKDNITIPNRPNKPILASGSYTIHSLTVQGGAQLTQSGGSISVTGGSIQISGKFTQNAGSIYTNHDFQIQKGGTFSQAGNLSVIGGHIEVTGTYNQTAGATFSDRDFRLKDKAVFNQSGSSSLQLSKDAGSAVKGKIKIDKEATLNQSGGTISVKDYEGKGTYNQTGATALLKVLEDWKPSGGSVFASTAGTVAFTGKAGDSHFEHGNTQFTNVIVDAGADPNFDKHSKSNILISGNFTNNNTALNVSTKATFTFNGNANQTISSAVTGSANSTFGNLVINNPGGTVSLNSNANVSGNISVLAGTFDLGTSTSNNVSGSGNLQLSAGTTMRLGGNTGGKTGSNFPNVASTSIAKTSTTEYFGSGQTVYPSTIYGNVLVSSAGTKTAGGNLNIAGSFTLQTATFVGGNYTHSVGVDWTMTSGTFNNNNSTVNFNGTGVQNISSTGAFNNVTINKTSGSTNLLSDITANGKLNFVKGNITTGNNKMIIPQTGNVTGAGSGTGWVNGNLQKYMGSLSGGTFEVGDALSYSPVSASFSGTFTPGSIIAKVIDRPQPNVASSTIANKNISRYWNLTKPTTGGVAFSKATLGFNWPLTDNYSPVNSTAIKVAEYATNAWSYPSNVGTPVLTSVTATNITALGDFAIGEPIVCTVSSGFTYSASELCTSGAREKVILNTGATAGTFTSSAGIALSNKGEITLSSSTPGIYTITNTVAGSCPSTSTATVKISAVSAAISYPGKNFCQSMDSVHVTLTGNTGGTFSSSYGVILDDVTGQIDLLNSTPGNYTINYTVNSMLGCSPVIATYKVTVTPANYANISYSEDAYCLNGGIATVDFGGTPGGTYSSTAGLSINASTGDIALASCTPGTYTVTYSGVAADGCASFSATTDIVITALAPSTITYAGSPFCYATGIAAVTLTGQGGGVFSSTAGLILDELTGDINIDSSATGIYTVVYSLGGCFTTATVTINNPATILYDASPYCGNATTASVIFEGTTGGVFSSAAGLSINSSTGDINPSASTGGNYVVAYTIPASNGCAAFTTTTSVTITAMPAATIFYDQSPFCSSDPAPQSVTFAGTSGGTFSSLPGLKLDTLTGVIIPASSTPATYMVSYTIAAAGGCPAVIVTTPVTVTPAPYAIITYPASAYCKSVTTSVAVKRTGNASGTYSSTTGLNLNATTGSIIPSSSTPGTYTVTYTVPSGGGCAAFSATTTITITAIPSATISYFGGPFCTNITTPVTVNQTGTSGGTFTAGSGLALDGTTGEVIPSLSTVKAYTVTYAIPAIGGCAAFTTNTSVTITQGPSATISYTGSPFCNTVSASQSPSRTGTTGGTYSSTIGLNITSAGIINPSLSTPGTYKVSYTVPSSGSCPVYIATTNVTITAKPSTTISYPANPYCAIGPDALVNINGITGGSFSSTTGLSLHSTTGTAAITLSTVNNYTVTYSLPAMNGCAAYTTTAPLNINLNAVWTGSVSKDWHDPNNWSCGGVPTIATNVIIPGGLSRYPIIYSGAATSKNLTIQTGASIIDSGSLTIVGIITNSGYIDAAEGKVEFAYSSAQMIQTSLFSPKIVQDLVISNPVGVTFNGQLRVTGSVAFGNVNNSTFTTGDSLTIASTASRDACVKDITNAGVNFGNVIKGLVIVERYMPAKRAYRFLTAPVNSTGSIKANWMENSVNPDRWKRINPYPGYGTNITGAGDTLNGFDPTLTHNPSAFTFNNLTQAWVPLPNTKGIMSAGNAYRIVVRGDRDIDMNTNTPSPTPTTLRAKGTLIMGDVTLTKAGAGGTAGITPLSATPGAYNLIANPYASAINWLTTTKNDISGTIYAFDPIITGSAGRGGYVGFNSKIYDPATGNMGVNSNASSNVDKYIQSGQAFFVQTIGPNPSVRFKETDKEVKHRKVFRSGSFDAVISVQLLLPSQQTSAQAADGVKIYFSDNYTNAIGDEDSYKFTNQDENIAVMREGYTFCIEGRKPITNSDSILLKVWQLSQKNYLLKISFDNFNFNVEAYLKDNYLSTLTQLSNNGETVIPVNITSDAASYAPDRYKIVFETVATLPLHLLGIKAVEKNRGVEVGWTAESEYNMDRYEVEKSLDGQNFVTAGSVKAKADRGAAIYYSWFDLVPSRGDNYYRIKSIDKGVDIKFSKVAKVRLGTGPTSITVFPNPIRGKRITLQFTDIKKGNYTGQYV